MNDTIRSRHVAWPMADPKPPSVRCAGCNQEWPCDVELMARERDAAEADATALAEAVDKWRPGRADPEVLDPGHVLHPIAHAALAAHDARVKP